MISPARTLRVRVPRQRSEVFLSSASVRPAPQNAFSQRYIYIPLKCSRTGLDSAWALLCLPKLWSEDRHCLAVSLQTPSTSLRLPSSLREGVGKRCSECGHSLPPYNPPPPPHPTFWDLGLRQYLFGGGSTLKRKKRKKASAQTRPVFCQWLYIL